MGGEGAVGAEASDDTGLTSGGGGVGGLDDGLAVDGEEEVGTVAGGLEDVGRANTFLNGGGIGPRDKFNGLAGLFLNDAILTLTADGEGDGRVVALPATDHGHFVLIRAGNLIDGGCDNTIEGRGLVDGPEPFHLVAENGDGDGVGIYLNATIGIKGGGGG